MKLEDYKFGYADAAKELLLEPSIFLNAFYDPKNILEKLQSSWKYILIGRKGVGKSAYNAKIQSLSATNGNFLSYPIPLNNFEYSTFSKTNSDSDVVGTKKYLESWNFILLHTIFKILYNNECIREVSLFVEMVDLLDKLGFPITNDVKKNITNISKLKVGANIGFFDAEFEKEFGTRPVSYTERLSSLIDRMKVILNDMYLSQKIFVLIDGVDDILRLKKNQLDILSSLIRSIDGLNEYFVSNKIEVKIIIFIREDIINNITDPDLNKIKRDGSITLTWINDLEDLKEIVELRFKLSGISQSDSIDWWYTIFPRIIHENDSWSYFLEHTLYKPRDVLQFLSVCQELYPDRSSLNRNEMLTAIKNYSKEYFIEEMKNELAGFSDDSLINTIPSILKKIGSRSFLLTELLKITNEQVTNKQYTEQEIRYLLLLLFEAGYVGQLINNGSGRESVVFKYRNTTANIDYSQKFLTHRGLHKGLGIII